MSRADPTEAELSAALETVWGDSRSPSVYRPGDPGYNPWRQVEPAMAYMRHTERPADEAANVIAAAYASMRDC